MSLLAAELAGGEICLLRDRIWSTQVIDGTILITDINKAEYTVHMIGACVGLDRNAQKESFRTKTEIGCLGTATASAITGRERTLRSPSGAPRKRLASLTR